MGTAAASAVCNTAIAIITIKQPIVNAVRNTKGISWR